MNKTKNKYELRREQSCAESLSQHDIDFIAKMLAKWIYDRMKQNDHPARDSDCNDLGKCA